jgi:DNA-directed RNA polymerase specialized sigma24 family protein
MFGMRRRTKKMTSPTPLYATGEDFCRIFQSNMNRLYLLSFLLTGNPAMAEKCFVGGLEDAKKGNPVFKEWAESWARRAIILNAIRMIRPRPNGSTFIEASDPGQGHAVTEPAEIADVVELPPFERFAFVMSVLEGYSDQECALLFGCTRGEVNAARTRALQHLGRSAELRRKLVSIDSSEKGLADDSGLRLRVERLVGAAASA